MLVTTPDGRQVYLPDGIVPPPLAFRSDDIQSPGGAGPLPLPPPPPPPPPPPQKVEQGPTGPAEYAAASPESVTGGHLPTGNPLESVPSPGAPADVPVQLPQAPAPQSKKAKAAAAQQAAFQASPEGQAQQAGNEAQQANADQAAIAQAGGEVEAREAADVAGLQRQGLANAQKIRAEGAAEQEAAAKRKAELTQQYDSAVTAEANYKVDDNRRWKEMGTGRKLGFWIMAALSGLGDALQHKTGPNMVIGMMQETIQRDVAAQVREREQAGKRVGIAKNSLDTYRQLTGDMMEAHKLKLAEEYERTAKEIEAAAGQYAGEKAKLRGEALAAQFRQQGAALRAQTAESAFNRDVKRQELQNQKAQIGVAQGHLALSRQQFAYQQKHDDDVLKLQLAEMAQKGQLAQAKAMQEGGAVGGVPMVATDADGKPVTDVNGVPKVKYDVMRQANGDAWLPGQEASKAVRPVKAATDTLLQLMDEARRLRTGWTSDTARSDEWQQLKANWAAAQGVAKDLLGLGALSGPDMELIDKFIGTNDPTQWRNPDAGIKKARDNILNIANNKFRAYGFDGTYAPPDLGKAEGPKAAPGEEDYKGALKTEATSSGVQYYSTAGKSKGESSFEAGYAQQAGSELSASLRTVDGLGAMLGSKDPNTYQVAAERLGSLSRDAQSPDVRKRAQQLLEANLAKGP